MRQKIILFIERNRILYTVVYTAVGYFKRLLWFWGFAYTSLCRGMIWSSLVIFVLGPVVSLREIKERQLATRGRIPEFHYTLS